LTFLSCQAFDRSLFDMASKRLRFLSLASRFLSSIEMFISFPRNCPPTPTGVVSRDSSGDKRHLHVSCLTPRLGGSASRWILADLHRATNIVPYQYPVLVSSREAHCLRGQHGRHQRKTPEDLGGARPFGVGQSRSLLSKTL
jgi:hypothetical protein